MIALQQASARIRLNLTQASELANLTADDTPTMAIEDVEDQLGAGTVILDGLRRRPSYFDGRFLTGADLTRDQDYVRQRQDDMARASGVGVVTGLQADAYEMVSGQTIRIAAGVGLTPSGDVVMVSADRAVPLLDLPVSRQLDAAMGLRQQPRVPLGRRTGLFILALRPVEFTANPIAAYPRSITGQRTVEDGDIIEATAITLIPFPDQSGSANLNDARRAVAKAIFAGDMTGMPQDALPLAMLAIDHGTLRWLDMAMVRREVGANPGVQVMLGGRPQALAEAHVLQNQAHLRDVLADLLARGQAPTFTAAQQFAVLPPAGQLPAAAIRQDSMGFTQTYFPPSMDVDLAFVPDDEIAALVDESLLLPVIDLTAAASDLAATGIVMIVPVARERFQRFSDALSSTTTDTNADPAQTGSKPALQLLSDLVARRTAIAAATPTDTSAAAAQALQVQAWQAAFQEAVAALPVEEGVPPLLWFVRRRSVAYQSTVAGAAVAVSGDDVAIQATVNDNIDRLGLTKRVAAITGAATPQATARLIALLGAPAIAGSDILTAAVVSDLEKVVAGDVAALTPSPAPASTPAPTATPAPSSTIPILATARPTLSATTLRSALAVAAAATPAPVAATVSPATVALADRAGLARIAAATSVGSSTAARDDTKLALGESEVMDIASDYSGVQLGEGLALLEATVGNGWPDPKGAVWIGGTGLALPLDAGFRALAPELRGGVAELVKDAVAAQNQDDLSAALAKIG